MLNFLRRLVVIIHRIELQTIRECFVVSRTQTQEIPNARRNPYGVTAEYKKYQELFDVSLPNPPPEKEIDTEEKQKFFGKQIHDAEKDMKNKPNHIARQRNFSDFNTERRNGIKNNLRKDRQTRSQVDRSKIITNELWTISVVRQPDARHCLHAFLILEGKEANELTILFADFVAGNPFYMLRSKFKGGKVRIQDKLEHEVHSPDKLLYSCKYKMMKIEEGSRLLYSTWSISKHTAQKLITNLNEKKKNPPPFNLLGDSKLAKALRALSSNSTSYNCFTFAKTMLHDLNDEHIQVPGDRLDEWIVSAANRHLVDTTRRYVVKNALIIAVSFLGGMYFMS